MTSKTTPFPLSDGLIAVVKRDCPTCELVAPVLVELSGSAETVVFSQDDPGFPEGLTDVVDDRSLDFSWHNEIETVPTLIRVAGGVETERIVGWSKEEWEKFSGLSGLGSDLPEHRPGCGSLSVDPNYTDELEVRFGGSRITGRRIELAALEDEMEMAFDRGWSDGLPVVPPTEARVLRMLDGTSRDPQDIVATVPPDLNEVTVEQVAINAVMAGCKPEYLPVVLTAVEAACESVFNMHGLLATTMFSGPIIIVNGPIAQRIGMNAERNALGQGNRANSTIGRALQLVVRNLGGGKPGEVDMSAMGAPSKIGLCFAEREHDSPFDPLCVERGIKAGTDALTLFGGQGPTPIIDQLSRTPESLVRSFASVLRNSGHPKLAMGFDAMLLISPEHARTFRDGGWDSKRLRSELDELLILNGDDIVRGADGIDEGFPTSFAGRQVPKFRPGGLLIAHVGGDAGMFSAVMSGWAGGPKGSEPVSVPITPWL